jgi:hypothetical protein
MYQSPGLAHFARAMVLRMRDGNDAASRIKDLSLILSLSEVWEAAEPGRRGGTSTRADSLNPRTWASRPTRGELENKILLTHGFNGGGLSCEYRTTRI